MLRFDSSKQMILPSVLAFNTTPYMLHRSQLSGLGQDDGGISLQDVITWGTSAYNAFTQASTVSDMVSHVQASFSQLGAQYAQLKASNQLSASVINQYETAVRNLMNSFCSFASGQGTAGQVGCQEVTQSANQLISSWELDKASLGVLGAGNLPLLVIGAVVLYMFLRR
jgi:hypothetical protein